MAKVEYKPQSGVTASEMKCGQVEVKHTMAAETFQQNLGVRLQRYKETKYAKEENKHTMAANILMRIKRTHMAADMAHKYVEEHGTNKVVLLEEFKCHATLFSEEEANQFPPSRGEADHKIVLLDTAPAKFNCKVYPMLQREREIEDKFLDENLAKGYIVPSDSPYGFSTFMVPKKDTKEMRYIINYRPLNEVTRRDITPLPNLGQCIENLQGMELFSKFNIWWGYNNIRICLGDE